ncbi:unnamed protein product [Allacma fusca]|uniref:C2H2-type domain-containing protein n=1 Tax=Allacma fusca TaxID=39272 RepID=A0A8J2NSZ4_9HEXA|nr:unnamed protein product [Allacma fusca]
MDSSRSQYTGFWFVCKYCQRVFRDKLELFCHQVNDHQEYREELNGNQRNLSGTHEVVYNDPRPMVQPKRETNTFLPTTQQHSSWHPPATGHIPNHTETQNYYTNPVEYYVVVPNQGNQTQMNQTATTTSPVKNIPIVNQQVAHSSSMVSHQPQVPAANNIVTLRNEVGNEWNKIGGDSSESDTTSSSGLNKDDFDYYCWKCKVKFGNAAAYITHSSSCFPPGNHESSVVQPRLTESEPTEHYTTVINSRKRGKKPLKVENHQPKRRAVEEEIIEEGPSTSSRNRRRKGFPERSPDLPNSSGIISPDKDKVTGTIGNVGVKPTPQDKNFPCTHCGLKFSSYDKLTSHLLQCKSKKNPYDSYEYKCIKCKASFEVYLQYKKHIETHTGVVKYS